MSICMPGTSIDSKKQREKFQLITKDPRFDKWNKDPLANELGWTDRETFNWLWKKYTGTYFDPATVKINRKDVGIFLKSIDKEWLPSIKKRKGYFESWFKLPRVLAKGFKGGEEFVTDIGEAVGYNQKLIKDGSNHIKNMKDAFNTMVFDGNHPIIKGNFTPKQYRKFVGLEKELTFSEPGTPQYKESRKNLDQFLGTNDIAGQFLRRYQDLLEFKVQPVTSAEKDITRHWEILRLDSMRDLLNGSIASRRIIDSLLDNNPNKAYLIKAHNKIREQIDALLVQADVDKRYLVDTYKLENGIAIPNDPKKFHVYDPKTKLRSPYLTAAGKEVIGVYGNNEVLNVKYSPHYVIELSDIMFQLVQFSQTAGNTKSFNNKTANQISREIERSLAPDKILNRMKMKGTSERYFSLDPDFYLNKYIHDVASFNMRSRINFSYANVSKHLIEAVRNNQLGKGKAKIGEHASYLIDMLTEIKDTALMSNGSPTTGFDQAVRVINAFEYISKLGFSFKGGLKNRTQGLFNWVRFGLRGYRRAADFKNTSDRIYEGIEITNAEMINRQKKRFGYMIGERAEAANISAATAGSIDVSLIPRGFDIDSQGRLIRGGSSVLKNVADALSKGADVSSKYSLLGKIGSQQWAENKNRIKTFELQFAHSFIAESRRMDYHKARFLEKNGREAKTKEIWDYIEEISGNQSFEMVKMLHFDYDNWAKAKILRGRTGKVVGQFQHFKFAFFDLQYNIFKDAARDIKGFKMIVENPYGEGKTFNPILAQAMRMSALYTFIPALVGLVTDYDVGGVMSVFGLAPFEEDTLTKEGELREADLSGKTSLIDNPIVEEINKLLDFFGNSPNGDEKEMKAHYNSYYGKGPIVGNLGPFINDVVTAGELMDWWSMTSEEFQEHKGLNKDTMDPDWWYKVARIFNVQVARTAWKSFPAFAQGHHEKALRIETGLFKPKWITKWREKQLKEYFPMIYSGRVLPEIFPKDKRRKLYDRRTGEYDKRIHEKALASLVHFG